VFFELRKEMKIAAAVELYKKEKCQLCFNKPEEKAVAERLMWGDYYFMTALTAAIYIGKRT